MNHFESSRPSKVLPPKIKVIAFDISNTIENVETNIERQIIACREIIEYLRIKSIDLNIDETSLRESLRNRFKKLHCWRLINLIEPSPQIMWSEWMLPEAAKEIINTIADDLTQIWMGTWYERSLVPSTIQVLEALKRKGFRICCISNTLSTKFTNKFLLKNNLIDIFEVITLSSEIGFRKPHRILFDNTAKNMNADASSICYIGDQLSRDITGAINAGFGYTILIGSTASAGWHDKVVIWPDIQIDNLVDILEFI